MAMKWVHVHPWRIYVSLVCNVLIGATTYIHTFSFSHVGLSVGLSNDINIVRAGYCTIVIVVCFKNSVNFSSASWQPEVLDFYTVQV